MDRADRLRRWLVASEILTPEEIADGREVELEELYSTVLDLMSDDPGPLEYTCARPVVAMLWSARREIPNPRKLVKESKGATYGEERKAAYRAIDDTQRMLHLNRAGIAGMLETYRGIKPPKNRPGKSGGEPQDGNVVAFDPTKKREER